MTTLDNFSEFEGTMTKRLFTKYLTGNSYSSVAAESGASQLEDSRLPSIFLLRGAAQYKCVCMHMYVHALIHFPPATAASATTVCCCH